MKNTGVARKVDELGACSNSGRVTQNFRDC